jgi:spore germination protein
LEQELIYVVKEGDNVDQIARTAGIPVEELIWANQLEAPYRLAVGQALFVGTQSSVQAGRPSLYTFGYVYPFIDRQILDETLPWLTDLYVFSYGFTAEGELIPPQTEDGPVIEAARAAGVRPVMVLTPLGPDGRFNNHLVTELFASERAVRRLIWRLGAMMTEKEYEGLDIDFEYVSAGDRRDFAEFIGLCARTFNPFGLTVTAALAPKTSDDQPGLLYEGMDYKAIGEAANRVMLMTYEWGYSQGPPMAVAPIHMVRRVADYALTRIPAEKVSLGIPNYGYDWPLPYERGVTRARTINTLQAIQLAIDHGSVIYFDELAKSPYFHYWQYGIRHEVWFEDVRSLKAKFDLIKEKGLTGAGYWQLMSFYRPNWLLLVRMFELAKGNFL